MKRAIFKELQHWKDLSSRMPLLLRGARQVGKTYIVEAFAKQHFARFHNVNFEFEPEYAQCFASLDPKKIIDAITSLSGQHVEPGKSLLFLDEIQNCPQAIMALRYFKEKMPELHVIAAGSLLEFALHDEAISMPVGRVEYLYLKPLSFQEFLLAAGYDTLLENLKTCSLQQSLPDVLHNKLLELTQTYFFIGGMPATVSAYLDAQNYELAQRQQTIILTTYRDDFGKYAKTSDHTYLEKVFSKTPALVGQQIQYSKIDADSRSRDLKRAIQDLNYAGIIHSVYATTASGLPLTALINEKKFKLLYLDIGLINRAMRLSLHDLQQQDLLLVHKGALAEQFVGQELLAYMDYHDTAEVHFWCRDKKGSHAEVDYVINIDGMIIPIEVKAGKTGNLKSLHMLMQERQLPLGIRVSQQPLEKHGAILSIPFYLLAELPRLIKER